jgi:hypothetical protein
MLEGGCRVKAAVTQDDDNNDCGGRPLGNEGMRADEIKRVLMQKDGAKAD